jgi:CHAT domain-containing protein
VTSATVGRIQYTAILVLLSVVCPSSQPGAPPVASDAQALLAAGQYEQAETAARADVDRLRALPSENGALLVATATDVLVRALLLNGRGARDDTLTLARQSLNTKDTQLGPEHADLVPSLLNLGDVLVDAAEFEQSIAVMQRAVGLAERGSGHDSRDLAEALHHLGSALSAARRYDDALNTLERSLRLKEKTLDRADVSIARTLEEIGLVLQRKGDYERAGAQIRRAAAIQEAANIDHPAYAKTLNLIAQQLWFEGNLPESKVASERAVELAERTLRPDHPMIALSLRYLGGTVAYLGDLSQSLALKERALALAERNFGPSHHVTGEYLNALGSAELDNGDYPKARRHLQEALNIYEIRYGEWHEYVATALSVLAEADARLGDYEAARREQSRAVAIHARVGGPKHPFVATALTELATVYRDQGFPDQAIPLLERALAIRESNLGPNHRNVARTLGDFASTLMQAGQPTRAQQLAGRALGIWERLDAPDAPEYATLLALYAEIQGNRGDFGAAKEHYQRAQQIRGKVFGTAHPLYAETEAGLAATFAGLGDSTSAIGSALDAEETGRQHFRTTLRYLPERQSLTYAATRPKGLDLAMSLATADAEATSRVFDALVRSRALVLDEMAARRRARTDTTAADAAPLWAELTSARQRLANLVVRGATDLQPEQYLRLVDNARREKEAAERALAEKSATFREELNREEIGLEAVRATLPAKSALVVFARYERTVIAKTPDALRKTMTQQRALRTVPSYVAFIVPAGGTEISMVPLGSAAAIDPLVEQWHQQATGVLSASSDAEAEQVYRLAGVALKTRIWDPLEPHLRDAANVFVVPDGTLNLVSFASLPIGRKSYLIDNGPIIHYLSAERDLVTNPAAPTSNRGLLAVGGAAFDDPTLFTGTRTRTSGTTGASAKLAAAKTRSGCGDLQSLQFESLAETSDEVRDVARLWTDPPVEVLQNRNASERAFKEAAPGHRVLHLATHGFFLGAKCESASAATRGIGGLSGLPKGQANLGTTDNPLLLSGLALAGANRRAAAGPNDEDGILTAEEVAGLNLEGVEWAVLSACRTGLGEVKIGEGVFGLRRAFQIAGVHTVIMSLWSVEDQSAREWMRALYEGRLKQNLSTAEAVQRASLTVLHARRSAKQSTHPFYWAGFVAAGDWR